MSYVGEKYALAGNDGKGGLTNDHFEIIKRPTGEAIKYDGVLRRGFSPGETPFVNNWHDEQHWFENLGYEDACQTGKDRAKEEGVVLLEARPNLAERIVLWHPKGWKPEKSD